MLKVRKKRRNTTSVENAGDENVLFGLNLKYRSPTTYIIESLKAIEKVRKRVEFSSSALTSRRQGLFGGP